MATEQTRLALELQPDDAVARSNAAFGELIDGNAERARTLAQSVLDDEPGNDQAAALLIDSLSELGEIEAVNSFVEQNPGIADCPLAGLALGQHHRRQGKYEAAEESLPPIGRER